MFNKIEILKEANNYKGTHFVENANLSDIVRNLNNDIKEFGPELVLEVYDELFGEEFATALIPLVEDTNLLESVSKFKNTLLFEADFAPLKSGWSLKGDPGVAYGANQGLRSAIGQSMAAPTGLAGLWQTIKNAGAGLMDKLGLGNLGLFKGGLAGWLKGAAAIVGPALLLFGGVRTVLSIINRLRAKKKMAPLSPQETDKIKDYAEKNQEKINAQREKAGQKPLSLT
jgi:hypothetical protein